MFDPNEFQTKAKILVAKAFNNDFPIDANTRRAFPEDFYVVWFAKVLGNWKAMISTDITSGRYYEVTYDGVKKQTYVDDYRKASNTCVTDEKYSRGILS